jgi:hypothetical protein
MNERIISTTYVKVIREQLDLKKTTFCCQSQKKVFLRIKIHEISLSKLVVYGRSGHFNQNYYSSQTRHKLERYLSFMFYIIKLIKLTNGGRENYEKCGFMKRNHKYDTQNHCRFHAILTPEFLSTRLVFQLYH